MTYPPLFSNGFCCLKASIILVSIVSLPLSGVAALDLVTNGDFETLVVTDAIGWRKYNGGESFPGWTVGGRITNTP
jgi:hypothetical protein